MRQEKLFEELNKQFSIEPIPVALDLDKKMRMKVDISDYAIGGVLPVECSNGQ